MKIVTCIGNYHKHIVYKILVLAPPTLNTMMATRAIQPKLSIKENAYNFKENYTLSFDIVLPVQHFLFIATFPFYKESCGIDEQTVSLLYQFGL